MSNHTHTQTEAELLTALRAVEIVSSADASPFIQADGAFEALSADVVLRSHAEGVMRSPDGMTLYEYQDLRLSIGSKGFSTKRGSFVTLALCDVKSGQRSLKAGYRLPCSEQDLPTLRADPSKAFAAFLSKYAVSYLAGAGRRVLFVPVVVLPLNRKIGSFEDLQSVVVGALGIGPPPNVGDFEVVLNVSTKISSDESEIRLAWCFAVNPVAYRDGVRQAQSRAA